MTAEPDEKAFDRLLHRGLVPRGLRPRSDQDIEKMLDTIGGDPVSDEKLRRMLAKIEGKVQPRHIQPPRQAQAPADAMLTEAEEELVKLYRNQGKALPPEIDSKVRAMEDKARRQADGDETHGGT